jgi:Glycine zipper 2TM domain
MALMYNKVSLPMRSQHPLLLTGLASLVLLGACDRPAPQSEAAPEAVATGSADVAAMAAKEAELAQREADLAAREAALPPAVRAPATATASAAQPVSRPAMASKPATQSQPVTRPAAAPAAAPRVVTVPSGTQLALALTSPLSSKTSKVGDTVRARLISDVLVDGKVAIAAGTTVAGQVTTVVSGSNKIGGVPTLGLSFERLELPGGVDMPISGEVTQKGKSDTARDTVKIVGGAAAGAILGNQVKDGDKGAVIGGLLGGAIGAVAAQKTGTEVTLTEGTELSISLAAPVEITKR